MSQLIFSRATVEDGSEGSRLQSQSGGGHAAGHEPPIIIRYLRVAKRRKFLILGAIAAFLIAGVVITLLMTPQFTAAATLEIQRENNRIVQVRGVEPESSSMDLEFYQTQYGLLQAQSLAERVATRLRLYNDPAFFDSFGAAEIASQLRQSRTSADNAAARQERIRKAGEILLKHLQVLPGRLSRLVEIRFSGPNAVQSAQIANAWGQDFIQATLARRYEATSYARRFLEERLTQLRQRLEESERTLVAYAAQQNIINITETTNSTQNNGGSVTERPLVAENLAALNRELNEAIAARVTAESRLGGRGGESVEALQNQAISALRERRAELAGERARMLIQFEADYPPVRALASQIRQLDQAIAGEEGRVRNTLQSAFRSASERESVLRSQVQVLQRDLLNLRSRTIQYNIYQRDVDTNRQLYDALLQRYKEIGVAGGVGVNNVSIVDSAQVPRLPSSPRLLLNIFLSLIVGAITGIGLALALDQVDEAISDPGDVERTIGVPLLGTIPKSENTDPETDLEDRKSPLVEAYLSAQASLGFTTDHGLPRNLMVTSTSPGEGKSTTAYALARSLARTGRSVILVDADMRSPSLHHFFDATNDHGLSNYLSGSGNIANLIQRGFPGGMALLSAGPSPPNAAELLTGPLMGQAISELSGLFEHVVIDAPPVMGLADAPLLASRVEGVVFVVESHATRASVARVAIGRLRDAQARILGVLLTKFESKRAHYGYGYDYGYGYGTKPST
jgi:capsular exopolysaccharide synthesis family protein